jgi:hypothetical protein
MRDSYRAGDDQPTCGKGLAANAVLPAKLAELMDAQADVLERHAKALDRSDPNAQAELETYVLLARAHRDIASGLSKLADQMAGSRDLPMARHDMAVMADRRGQMEAFARFVAVEKELQDLLRTKAGEDARQLA